MRPTQPRRRSGRWSAVLLAAMLISPVARADDFADARRAEAELDYEHALALVTAILARGRADPARLVELHLFAGEVAAGLGQTRLAEDHFARALALRPDSALDRGTSPKITRPFEAAAARRLPPLAVHAALDHGLVRVIVAADPLGLAVGIAVDTVDPAGNHGEVVARDALRVALPTGATAVEIDALDGNGNRVWVGPPPPPPAPSSTVPTARPPRRAPPRWARWTTWTVVGGVAAAGAGVFAWREHVAQNDYDVETKQGDQEFSSVAAIELRGRRYAVAADLGFGIAAAAAITGLVFGLVGRDQPAVTVAPAAGDARGASLVFTGHY